MTNKYTIEDLKKRAYKTFVFRPETYWNDFLVNADVMVELMNSAYAEGLKDGNPQPIVVGEIKARSMYDDLMHKIKFLEEKLERITKELKEVLEHSNKMSEIHTTEYIELKKENEQLKNKMLHMLTREQINEIMDKARFKFINSFRVQDSNQSEFQ